VHLPRCFVLDTGNEITKRIILELAITESLIIKDARIFACEVVFKNKDYEANLCHELGHIVAFSKKIHFPLDTFLNLLRNEIAADREGLAMFIRSGKRKYAFSVLYGENFKSLFEKLLSSKNKEQSYNYVKCLFINVARIMAFIMARRQYLTEPSSLSHL
jgi:hypothetical protein